MPPFPFSRSLAEDERHIRIMLFCLWWWSQKQRHRGGASLQMCVFLSFLELGPAEEQEGTDCRALTLLKRF